jgi:hypothetical protein
MPLPSRHPPEFRESHDPITGARIRQLTGAPADHFPLFQADSTFTPAGEALLFASNRGGAGLDLCWLDLETGEIARVTEDGRLSPEAAAPAADGARAIAALRGEEGEVVAIDLETGEWETLAVFPDAALDGCHLSASGEYIVTVVRREGEQTITAVHTEGMRTLPIHEVVSSAGAPRFSPDSRHSVLYTSVQGQRAAVCCVEFDGTGDRVLYHHEVTGRMGDTIRDISLTQVVPLTSARRGEQPSDSAAANAGWLTTASWLGSDEVLVLPAPGREPLLAVPRQGGPARLVNPRACAWARSSMDGSRIVALLSPENGLPPSSPNTRAQRAPAEDLNTESWDLVLLDPVTAEVRPLCSGCSSRARPTFRPDGGAVVFTGRDRAGHWQLFLATAFSPTGGATRPPAC